MASGGKAVKEMKFKCPPDAPEYLRAALDDIGIKEFIKIKGKKVSNPIVEEYAIKSAGTSINAIDVPWCAYWVGAKLEDDGITCSKSGMARSYLRWGKSVPRSQWRAGDLAVFWRGKLDDGVTGHVNFIIDVEGDKLICVGGNQGDSVSVEEFSTSKLLDVRRPRKVTESRTVKALSIGGANEVAVKPLVGNLLPSGTPLPDPAKVQQIVDEIKSPVELLASAKPWIMTILSAITVACIVYGIIYRVMDHHEGKNT